MKLIKLTDAKAQSYGGLQWGEGITHQDRAWGSVRPVM